MNRIEINELIDIYGELLTKRQLEILEYYYQDDLSYSEIAEELDISRAAVLDAVHKGIKQLEKYESVIQYSRKKNQLLQLIQDEELLGKVKELL